MQAQVRTSSVRDSASRTIDIVNDTIAHSNLWSFTENYELWKEIKNKGYVV